MGCVLILPLYDGRRVVASWILGLVMVCGAVIVPSVMVYELLPLGIFSIV